MKKLSKRALSVILSVLMLTTMLAVCGYSAIAATTDMDDTGATSISGETIYFKNTSNWASVSCYMWTDGAGNNAQWPGEAMTNEGDGIWSYKVKDGFNMIIFNNGGNGSQTGNLTYPGGGKMYNGSGFVDHNPDGTTVQKPTGDVTPTTTTSSGSTGNYTVYCRSSISQVYCYLWNSDSDKSSSWPGQKMTKIDDDVWEYTYSKSYKNCIFSGGNDSNKTLDLDVPGDGYIYDMSASKWEKYDTSPLKIRAFGADMESPQYKGCTVQFDTTAVSEGAVVEYQYSVNGAVAQSYSTNSKFNWTPSTTGAFTIKVDVKDNAGNTNSRETSFEIKDPSAEVKPVFLSSDPGNSNQVLLNAATNVKVNAAGGNTGTKLLFYKYVVKDPSGAQMNTAYYTLKNTYSFTPKTAGTYTVAVSIQGSDNQTITQELKYVAVSKLDPTTTGLNIPTTQTISIPTTPTPDDKMGDVNDDGEVNIQDATAIQKYLAGTVKGTFIEARATVCGGTTITIQDATKIQKYVAGKTTI